MPKWYIGDAPTRDLAFSVHHIQGIMKPHREHRISMFAESLWFRFRLVMLLAIASTMHAIAQSGSVHGRVTDQHSGEVLVGANVVVVGGTLGGVADLDGKYTIRGVPAGRCDLRFSLVGYTPKLVTGVSVPASGMVMINVDLVAQNVTADEVVITAERQMATESAILSVRRKAATISDGLSMEQVKRSPDATAGDALRRVTGISIVDNKFVFVRGVTDRYNATTLNGVSVTSTDTDVDKKSFSFDLVPASLVENTMVTKTATPDLPGDFTGGLVQVNTLDFPPQQVLKLSLSSSYNSLSNLRTLNMSQGGGRDWMGFDDGSRDLPAAAAGIPYNAVATGKSMVNNWKQQPGRAGLNSSARLTFGDRAFIGSDELGVVTSLSYRNGYNRSEQSQRYFRGSSRIIELDGVTDRYSVLWGGLADASFKFGGLNKISMKNSFTQSAEDKVSANTVLDENEQFSRVNITQWSQRSLYVGQLVGEHRLPGLGEIDLRWRLAYSSSRASEPDRKTYIYGKNINYPASFPLSFTFADRSWSNLFEDNKSASVDLSLPLFGEATVKAGGVLEGKRRDYKIEFFQGELSRSSLAFHLLNYAIDSLFAPANFGADKLVMTRLSDERDKYTGDQTVKAAYAMLDLPFSVLGEQFRFVGGLRIEDAEQRVYTLSPFSTNEFYTARIKKTEKLPSLNLTWIVSPVANLRFAHSQSVNRPEFRELAVFYFYDYNTYQGTYGNPLLQRAYVHNYDVRFEVFPDVGEVLAISGFYKAISNAIEQRVVISSNPELTWFNSGHGRNLGFELEARKSLGFLGDYFRNISISANFTYIQSSIEYLFSYKEFMGAGVYEDRYYVREREMQGQSPYMINGSLQFIEPSLRTSISLMYYEYGRRLDAIGDQRDLDVYEEAVGVLDLAVTQPLSAMVELKATARDLTASKREYRTREGSPYQSRTVGTTYTLELSLTF
jgi:hypothetical protein